MSYRNHVAHGYWEVTTYNKGLEQSSVHPIRRACLFLSTAIQLGQLNRVGVRIRDENGCEFWMRDKRG